MKFLALAVLAVAAGAAWRWTPLGDLADPQALTAFARPIGEQSIAIVLAPVAFLALSSVLVPLPALRFTTLIVFGPVLGALCAIASVALCAFVGHAIGARLGSEWLERRAPRRVAQLRAFTERRNGVLSIAALRLVPLGPFMLVNAAAGAARLRRRDFVAGTVLGLMPGLVFVIVLVTTASA